MPTLDAASGLVRSAARNRPSVPRWSRRTAEGAEHEDDEGEHEEALELSVARLTGPICGRGTVSPVGRTATAA